MKITTRDFGEVEIASDDIIRFKSPIYGFESLMEFVFLYEEGNNHIVWLQSIENPHICFVLVDPSVIDREYTPVLPGEITSLLTEGEYWIGLVVVVAPNFEDSTVNLKSPIVVNLEKRLGAQAILEEDYPIRYPLVGNRKG